MKYTHMKHSARMLGIARLLRRNMTKQEKHLWYDFLRRYKVKIYKQHVIDNFVADFYCHKARLVIELDGSQHYTKEGCAYDANRTAVPKKHGLTVLRFTNIDVNEHFESVCEMIDQTITKRIESQSLPPLTR